MEIIDPRDIMLVKFLGSGGYGEVHLGKWHSSEAAIKCLNPSLFFQVTAGPCKTQSLCTAAMLGDQASIVLCLRAGDF